MLCALGLHESAPRESAWSRVLVRGCAEQATSPVARAFDATAPKARYRSSPPASDRKHGDLDVLLVLVLVSSPAGGRAVR